MFDRGATPRVFGLAPGVDFPRALVDGLTARMAGQPPEAMARVQVIVNTERMARRLRMLFDDGPALLLPRIRLITDLAVLAPTGALLPALSPLRRRLELIKLISQLLDQQPDLAPRASLYDLADSLAGLMDEMQGEGVAAEDIANLDVTDQSGHWQRAQSFISIAQTYIDQTALAPDPETRQRRLVEAIVGEWRDNPPHDPIILAGSTGSRGTTQMLMQAVARLPQGALVLPGFDFDMPAAIWSDLDDAMLSEDHPQYRFHALMRALDLGADQVEVWHDTPPPSAPRNALVSLSLRPAPVTDAWMTEGTRLRNLDRATAAITLVRAETPRVEALTIAMRLRHAVENGQAAALITPDRMLTRQVTSALDRWDILPDDSAGTPLQLTPPGRFLRHVAGLFVRRLDAEAFLTLLKHPLTHSGADRNLHQLNTQRLELRIRRDGLPYPDAEGLARLALKSATDEGERAVMSTWAAWVGDLLCDRMVPGERPLGHWVDAHLRLAEALSAGPDADTTGELWKMQAGEKARATLQSLQDEAPHGGSMTAADYADLVGALLSQGEVRDRDAPHPDVMIWGTLEARVQGADLVILGGLNDGTWPEAPKPDPWLNRAMRQTAGLLLPERRIGLSAHDYQQAVAAPEVWLTRSIRSDDAETVPSRWLNRLENLMRGLPKQGGQHAWDAMTARGDQWLGRAARLEQTVRVKPARRPSPRPPVAARPDALSVTEIKRLIRDPFAIYAKHTLRLSKMGPLVQGPDAAMRGNLVHDIMERFIKTVTDDPAQLTATTLMRIADDALAQDAPWPAARAMWRARIERVADWFIAREAERQAQAKPIAFEDDARGKLTLPDLGFTLTARADRIDRTDYGDAMIYDYKTGTPPSAPEQAKFDKQLLIMAAMIEEGAFEKIGPLHVARATFVGLGSKPVEVDAPLEDEPPREVLAELRSLIAAYLSPEQGFTARRMMQQDRYGSDYDQLARFGEWDATQDAYPEDLT
ncbi:double-strand break repair protein AddB [Sulfitobacter sabulilitoris]|uniref:Double-strand break repair protein AddB n=1 Tax=Sulfitobacter sabulilitoris TaxID=2562655 RepID=A0A5S3PEY1_9RHOB|nr:double-strand break repair protein AddB [Sulfitobacter sabulilitoris]TMM52587.1 double-strand break repair protein AddB [Sulfitobacter sabulilitoris]